MQDRAKATSERLIARHGGAAVLVREGSPPVNPWDPPAGEPDEIPVTFLEGGFEIDLINGTLVQAGDVLGVMGGNTAPLISDRLQWRGRDHVLVGIHPIQPDGDGPPVHWRLHARVA